MFRRIGSGLAVWTLALGGARGAIFSFPGFAKLASAPYVAVVQARDMETAGRTRFEPEVEMKSLRYVRGAGPAEVRMWSPMRVLPSGRMYLVFFTADEKGGYSPADRYLSFLPVSEGAAKTGNDVMTWLGAALTEGMLSGDAERRAVCATLLAGAPREMQEEAWVVVEKAMPEKAWSEAKAWRPELLLALVVEGSRALERLPNQGNVPVLEDRTDSYAKSNVDGTIASWVYHNKTPENAEKLLTFALAQPAEQCAAMVNNGPDFPKAEAGRLLERMRSPRSGHEQYACLHALARMYQRCDLVPGASSFMKNPGRYVPAVERMLAGNGVK